MDRRPGSFPGLLVLRDQLRGSHAYMFGGDQLAFFRGGGDESARGEMVGSAEQPPGTLIDAADGLFGEEGLFHPGDFEVVYGAL
jgi:hypothetical protein